MSSLEMRARVNGVCLCGLRRRVTRNRQRPYRVREGVGSARLATSAWRRKLASVSGVEVPM